MFKTTLLVSSIILVLTPSWALAKEYKSNVVATNTIELFTSEGCSSCPPADRWVSEFLEDKRLFKDTIPLVFHVNYWDYLGWSDPYASSQYTQRQKLHEAEGRSAQVYTPEFIVNNKEWRAWFNANTRTWQKTTKKVGLLKVNHKEEAKTLDISFEPLSVNKNGYKLNVAILGMGIKSHIKRGENSGETLIYDFVVLKHKTYKTQKKTMWTVPMLDIPNMTQKESALVVWISPSDSEEIVQSVGGYLGDGD